MFKIDNILNKIKELGTIEGDNPTALASQLDIKPDTMRYIIKQIKKSHCNGATAEYAKYSQFVIKDKFPAPKAAPVITKLGVVPPVPLMGF